MTRLLNEADAEELTYAEQRATLAEHLPPRLPPRRRGEDRRSRSRRLCQGLHRSPNLASTPDPWGPGVSAGYPTS